MCRGQLWSELGRMHGVGVALRSDKMGTVCHDEVVVECDADRAPDVEAWVKKAMNEGMEAVLNITDEVDIPIEVDARIARGWGERD